MSDESTQAIAEKWQLEKELRAGAQPRTVQLVNTAPLPVGAIIADPNKTRAEIPHPTPSS
jgi:hypothetical protein